MLPRGAYSSPNALERQSGRPAGTPEARSVFVIPSAKAEISNSKVPTESANTFVRQRIKTLRRSKGMTQSQLGQLAGIPASTIGSLEGGFYRLNVDLLHRIVGALGVDIGTVWPRSERSGEEPTGFFRLRELHLLTAAEASCVLVSDCSTNASRGRVLYSIGSGEIPEIQSDQQQHGAWIIFLRHGRAKKIALCLKNAAIDDWMELLIERYLPLWLLNVEI